METQSIFGCYISYPTLQYGCTVEQKQEAKTKGDLFKEYIWGKNGIDKKQKQLPTERYGQDLQLILLQFHINPLECEMAHLLPIERFRKKEKAIGIPIIITDDNFFNLNAQGRIDFIQNTFSERLGLLDKIVKRNRLDTDIVTLRTDIKALLQACRTDTK